MTTDCAAVISQALGRPVTEDELERITEAVQMRIKAKVRDGATARDAAKVVSGEMTQEAALARSLARRDAYNNILIRADLQARIVRGQEDKIGRSLMSGYAASGERNMANSVDATHHTLRGQLLAPALKELQDAGLLKAMQRRDPALDRDVARELRRLKDPTLERDTGNKQAKQIAQILGGVMDTGRAMMNKAGAFIGEVEGYMGRQYHDMWKVRGKGTEADFQYWKANGAKEFNLDKMYPDLSPERVTSALRDTWQALSSGLHDTASKEALGGFQGGANVGKKVSQGRSIIMQDADSWVRYNEKFGKGGVMDAVLAGADSAARDTALMQKFGTNPKMMWDWLHDKMMNDAYDRSDFKMGDKLKAQTAAGSSSNQLFDLVSGRGGIPGNATLATIGATVRNTQQLIHLGSIVFSALSHIPINAELMRHNGSSFWAGLGNQLRSLVPRSKAEKEIALSIHAGIDGMMGHIIQRFRTEDGVPGRMAEAVHQFHKWNGFGMYMDGQAAGIGLGLSHSLAYHAGKAFDSLDPKMQTTLRRYGIEHGEWDAGRASAQKAADGRNYLIPSNIADAPVAQKFQTFITDQIHEGMNTPTPYARLQTTLGTRAGTWGGEIVRAVMQFKSFAVSMMERQAGRMQRYGKFDYPGAMYLVAGMTMAGYAGMTLRGIASNQMPRQPTDAAGWAGLVKDSMVAGGGVGLYGDLLLRGGERSGGDILHGLAGPAPSTAVDTLFGIKHIMDGGTKSRGAIAAEEGQHLLASITPNHVFLKAANDYLLGHFFREMVSPGATRRYNALLKEKGSQQVMTPALQR